MNDQRNVAFGVGHERCGALGELERTRRTVRQMRVPRCIGQQHRGLVRSFALEILSGCRHECERRRGRSRTGESFRLGANIVVAGGSPQWTDSGHRPIVTKRSRQVEGFPGFQIRPGTQYGCLLSRPQGRGDLSTEEEICASLRCSRLPVTRSEEDAGWHGSVGWS